MQIEQEKYLNKLIEVYQNQCNQYLQERVSLQAQLDLVLTEIEKLEAKILEASPRAKKLDPEINEELDVNENTDT